MPIMRSALVIALLAIAASSAEAHIHLLEPLSRTDDALGDPQKNEHCGDPAVKRIASRVTTFKPGQTITVKWAETIPHLGWYRVAFQPNGEVFPIPPASNGPRGNGAPSNYPTEDLTGKTDGTTGTMILKDRILDMTPTMTMVEVTLPDMECDNCTLQLIQVMTDTATYEPANDIYFNCADVTLAANPVDPDPSGMPDGGTGGGDNNGGGNDGGEISSGCSTGHTTSLGALALLGLVGLRRRWRRH